VSDEEDDVLDLSSDEGDELLLDAEDILTSPVSPAPIAPPNDDDVLTSDDTGETSRPTTPPSGTLFERMSNIARGAAKAQADEDETRGIQRDPIDIPRFLNRQNNQ
jgi:cell division protein FtsZ